MRQRYSKRRARESQKHEGLVTE